MGRLSRLLARAAKQVVSDPRVRSKAAEVFEKEIKPRADAAWQQAKPKLQEAGAKLQDKAARVATRENLDKVTAKVKEHVRERVKRRGS